MMFFYDGLGLFMDEIPQNSINQEKSYFLSKLKCNPFFIIKHIPSLSHILWQRYKIKILKTGNLKSKPSWLPSSLPFKITPNLSEDKWLFLLQRHLPQSLHPAFTENMQHHYFAKDQEDYLAKNRWGELLENIFMRNFTLPMHIKNWLNTPPNKKDPAWETYSCSERIANFITWASFIPKDERFNYIPANVLNFIEYHAHWIMQHLEYYRKRTNNHIINNARALIMAGSLLQKPEMVRVGFAILKNMLPILIQPQGSLREGSAHYHLLVFRWLLDAYTFAKTSLGFNSEDIYFLHHLLIKMQMVAALFCDSQGELNVFIGDISPDARPRLTTLTLKACYPDYWPQQNLSVTSVNHYDDWYGLYQKEQKVILHCHHGKYPQAITTHKHNDLSSFVWVRENQPLLIDTGCSRYLKEPIPMLQKSALGHNVALVNNMAPLCESMAINGYWCPTPYANADVHVQSTEPSTISITHNGFKRATPVKTHTRQIQLLENELIIKDIFLGNGSVDIKLIWQLHPSFKAQNASPVSFKNNQYQMDIVITATLQPDFACIQNHAVWGWTASEYGALCRHPILVMNWKIQLPFETMVQFKVKTCVV